MNTFSPTALRLTAWNRNIISKNKMGEVLAMDGKALRGTRITGQERSDYTLSIYEVENQYVMAKQKVDSKENEIVAAPRALEQVPLAGKFVTGDAMHTQKEISKLIVDKGGAYLWPVKENQPRLYEAIQRLFVPDKPKPGCWTIPL